MHNPGRFACRSILTFAVSLLLGITAACGSGSPTDHDDLDGSDAGPVPGEECAACEPELCYQDRCLPDLGPCSDDENCINDSYCWQGHCIPWGSGPRGENDPACEEEGQTGPIGVFAPAVQCEWTAPPPGDVHPTSWEVLPTALVADFDFDGDPDQRRPSIVFVTWDGVGGYDSGLGVVRVIDGGTCAQQHTIDLVEIRATSPLAIGDVDLDGRPDIVAIKRAGGLVAFGYDAAAGAFRVLWSTTDVAGTASVMWDGPSIHDLDDDGAPEILVRGAVYAHDGQLLDSAVLFPQYGKGLIPVAGDLDGDGQVELVNGASAWSWFGGRWNAEGGGAAVGQTAFADFGTFGADPALDDRAQLDGKAEIAVVSNDNTVRVQTLSGRVVFGPVAIPGVGGGGGHPPAVADFDGDGRAEISVAAGLTFDVFDPDCNPSAEASTCASLSATGVLWSAAGMAESTWGEAGSSAFDFERDGAAEVVYNDVCFLRVFEGGTGDVVFSQWHTSCTWYEEPVVADADGDGHTELVLSSNTTCGADWCTSRMTPDPTTGLYLDPTFRGLRCDSGADCGSDTCDAGFCRCTADAQCGGDGDGFACAPPLEGTPGTGWVCRSAFLGVTSGVRVIRDREDRWAGSRSIWNQQAYSVTNVNDDGTVPRTSDWSPNWQQTGLNNYRQNARLPEQPIPGADLTSRWDSDEIEPSTDCSSLWVLRASMCNRGVSELPADIPGTFYQGDPASGGQPLCTAFTQGPLAPGACEVVKCDWSDPADGEVDLWFVPDDDGTGPGVRAECKRLNNPAHVSVTCPGVVL